MRLIDADALAAGFENEAFAIERSGRPIFVAEVYRILAEHLRNEGLCPTIDPVKHGHWVKCDPFLYSRKCSECGEPALCVYQYYEAEDYESNYCPYCGAKMEEVSE